MSAGVKITADGRTHIGECINRAWNNTSLTYAFGYIDLGTGTNTPTESDAGVQTPLAVGGRRALDAGYPQIIAAASGPEIVVQATYPAGSFTTGTAITEAAWITSGGTKCAGRIVYTTPKNPSSQEPVTATLRFDAVAG